MNHRLFTGDKINVSFTDADSQETKTGAMRWVSRQQTLQTTATVRTEPKAADGMDLVSQARDLLEEVASDKTVLAEPSFRQKTEAALKHAMNEWGNPNAIAPPRPNVDAVGALAIALMDEDDPLEIVPGDIEDFAAGIVAPKHTTIEKIEVAGDYL